MPAPVIKHEPLTWQDLFQGSNSNPGYPGFNLKQENPEIIVPSRSCGIQSSRIDREAEQERKLESSRIEREAEQEKILGSSRIDKETEQKEKPESEERHLEQVHANDHSGLIHCILGNTQMKLFIGDRFIRNLVFSCLLS